MPCLTHFIISPKVLQRHIVVGKRIILDELRDDTVVETLNGVIELKKKTSKIFELTYSFLSRLSL